MPPTIKYECSECGIVWEEKTDARLSDQKCKKCAQSTNINITNPLIMSGLYCWVSAFRDAGGKGTMNAIVNKEYLENFDLVAVNFTPGHPTYIQAIRETLGNHSNTKIIANVDYATSMWGNINPRVMKTQLNMADFVFHVESTGAKILTRYLEKEVPCLPHPVDTDRIKKLRTQPHDPPTITCQWHRYHTTWDGYYYSLYKLPVTRVLVNMSGDRPAYTDLESQFDQVLASTDYVSYLKDILAPAWINIDLAPDNTFGRGVVDAAALGVPTIGSTNIDAMSQIWPRLTVDPFDHQSIEDLVNKLRSKPDWAKELSDKGQERCKYWNTKNSYERMRKALEERNLV
jgi:glycosyltransferase involved in cell wall biosynthesis